MSRPDAIAPDGSEIYFKVGNAERASLVEVRLGRGRVSRPVRHRTVEEIWYVTAGRGRVWRQASGGPGETVEVQPGEKRRTMSILHRNTCLPFIRLHGKRRGAHAMQVAAEVVPLDEDE